MSADPMREFGQMFGEMSRQQGNIADNLNANDPGDSFVVQVTANAALAGTLIVNQKSYATDSFILDHPVYGELDSSILELDGGYSGSPVEMYRKVF